MAADVPDPDVALMLRVKHGDRAAFTELVERWKGPVVGFAYRTLPDADEAEDLAQATFVQLWKTADRYQPAARFSTFLFTIARNLCLNEIRRRSRHPADSLDAASPSASGADEDGPSHQIEDRQQKGADAELVRGELYQKVEEAVRDLPEKQRTALLLCREGELSYEEIAGVLGTSLQATKSIIHRARETLKARLKPYLGTGEWSSSPPSRSEGRDGAPR